MYEHAGRREVLLHDAVKGLGQHLLLRLAQHQLAVLRHVPIGEQGQLAAQQSVVVGRQHAGARSQLPLQQRVGGLAVPGCGALRIGGVKPFDDGVLAEVREQQEAVRAVPVEHLRDVQAGLLHQALHLHERGAVFLVGRRVHHDVAGLEAIDAQVAAKAGVGRGQAQGLGPQAVGGRQGREPLGALRLALFVSPGNGAVAGSVGGVAHG